MSEEAVEYKPDVPVEAPADQTVEPATEILDPEKVWITKVEKLAKENAKLIKKHVALERSQQAMANQFKTMVESTVKQRLAELGVAKDEAIDLGDKQKVKEIEQQMAAVEQQAQSVAAPAPALDPAIQDFVDANADWFNKDAEMTEFAIAYNEAYLKRNPGSLEDSLAATLDKVKKAFPDKFAKEAKPTPPSPVEGATRQTTGNRYSISRLSEEQKIAYDQYVKRHKVMSHDEYFKSLEEAGYLA